MNKIIIPICIVLMIGGNFSLTQAQQKSGTSDSLQLAELAQKVDYVTPGKSRFLLRGYAHAGLEATDDNISFVGGNFNPILIYQQSDKLLFEGELEIGYDENDFEIGLEYANISYILSPYITLRLGKIFVPFGIFTERIHPAWINRFPNAPLGYGHDGNLPGTDIGAELRGGISGPMKFNYSVYIINGPSLNDGSTHEDDAGKLEFGENIDHNKQKAVGGRLGIFPFSNSMLELGVSGQYGKIGEKESSFEDVAAKLVSADLSFTKNLSFMSSVIDVKAQANWVNIDDANYLDTEDTTGLGTYTFENKSNSYFAQISLRPALVNNDIIRNLEIATRYSSFKGPEGALWETDQSQWAVTLNYWLDWRTVFKLTFQNNILNIEEGHLEPTPGGGDHVEEPFGGKMILFHWAIGF